MLGKVIETRGVDKKQHKMTTIKNKINVDFFSGFGWIMLCFQYVKREVDKTNEVFFILNNLILVVSSDYKHFSTIYPTLVCLLCSLSRNELVVKC